MGTTQDITTPASSSWTALLGTMEAFADTTADPVADPVRDITYMAGRIVKHAGRPIPYEAHRQAVVALTGAVLRILAGGRTPAPLAQMLPPMLRQLDIATVTGQMPLPAAIRLECTLDSIEAATGEAADAGQDDPATARAQLQARRELARLRLPCLPPVPGSPAPRNVLTPQAVNLIGLTAAAAANPHADRAVLAALGAIACSTLTVAATMGGEEAPATIRNRVQSLLDRLLEVAQGTVDMLAASNAICAAVGALVQAVRAHAPDGDALGCIDGLFAIAHDLNAFTQAVSRRFVP